MYYLHGIWFSDYLVVDLSELNAVDSAQDVYFKRIKEVDLSSSRWLCAPIRREPMAHA